MAGIDDIVGTLLAGTGFGKTPGDVTQQNLTNQGLAQQQTANDQTIALNAAKLAGVQRQAASDANFQTDWASYLKSPTTDGLAQLAVKYPTQADAIKQFWAIKDPELRQNHLETLAPIVNALQNNRPDMAIQSLQQTRDATANAGLPTGDYDQEIAALKTGDKDAINAVKGTMMMHLAAVDKDGKFADSLAKAQKAMSGPDGYTLGPNDTRFDGNNTQVATGQAKPTYEKIANGDGSESIVQVGGGGGASAAGGAPAPAAGGNLVTRMLPITLKSEGGGTLTNPLTSSRGAVGPMQVRDGTNLDPGFGVTPAKDDSQAERQRVGQDYLSAMVQKYGNPAQAWAAYNAGPGRVDAAIQQGGTKWLQQLPAETQQYVVKNMTALGGAQGNSAASASAPPDGSTAPSGVKVLYTSKPAAAGTDAATVDFYGQKVAAGGDLPQLGMGKEAAAMRQAILARAAQIQIDQGMTGSDSNLLHADVKTATTALAALQKTRNSLNPYLQTFDGASAQVRALAPQGVGGSIPIFNRWIQAGRTSVAGDPAVSKFNVAINAVANENAKIMSGASGGAISSDSARKEAMDLINNAQTLPTLMAVLDQMHTDTTIRMKSLDDRQAQLRATISGKGSGATPESGGAVRVSSRAQAMALKPGTVFITPDGRRLVR